MKPFEGRILLTGACGFVGSYLTKALVERQANFSVIYHRRLPNIQDQSRMMFSDLTSSEALAAPLRHVESVVHLAWPGFSHPLLAQEDSLQMNMKGAQYTENLVSAMEKAGTKKIIFLSAIGASNHSDVPFLKGKYAAESAILNSKIPQKMILRSAVVFSGKPEEDRLFLSIRKLAKMNTLLAIPMDKSPIHLVQVADVVQAILNALKVSSSSNQAAIVPLSSSDTPELRDVVCDVAKRLTGHTGIALTGWLARLLLPLFEYEFDKSLRTRVRFSDLLPLLTVRYETQRFGFDLGVPFEPLPFKKV